MQYIVSETDGVIATITFDNPASLNALGLAMASEFRDAVNMVAGDENIRCLVIGGAGRAFMAGGDLKYFHDNLGAIDNTVTEIIGVYHEIMDDDHPPRVYYSGNTQIELNSEFGEPLEGEWDDHEDEVNEILTTAFDSHYIYIGDADPQIYNDQCILWKLYYNPQIYPNY